MGDDRDDTGPDEWAALANGCGTPAHGWAVHMTGEADFVGEVLRGARLLLVGWGELTAHSRYDAEDHGRVALALDALLTACADKLQLPRPAQTAPAPTTERRLTVVSPDRPGGNAG